MDERLMSNIRTIPVDTHSEFSAFVTGLGDAGAG